MHKQILTHVQYLYMCVYMYVVHKGCVCLRCSLPRVHGTIGGQHPDEHMDVHQALIR